MKTLIAKLKLPLLLGVCLAFFLCWFSLPEPSPRREITPLAQQAAGEDAAEKHFGYVANPEESRKFVRSLPQPLLKDAGPDLFRDGRDKRPVLLYRALQKTHREKLGEDWIVGQQGIGDCVSWGWAHAIEIHQAVLYQLGEISDWKPVATEAIYGGSRVEARGQTFAGYADGSYGAAAARWCRDWGVLFREKYPTADLTKYSSARAKDWGAWGCGGKQDAGKLDAVAKQHPVKTVALVTTFDDAAVAVQSGYPITVCSNVGFGKSNYQPPRDENGFLVPMGSWAHCMCFVGVRFEPPGLLCLNSWGPDWVSGPKWPEDQPDGSFWVHAKIVDRMLSGEDSFAVSGFVGFPFRELKHGDWVHVERPPRERFATQENLTLAL